MKKILLVEDDDISRDVISTRLIRSGFEVAMVENGLKALEAVSLQVFDLIIMDLSMPTLTGWEAAKKLKASPATASIPVLALSALVADHDRKKALEAGCDDFDSKPIHLPRLLGKIEALLAGAQANP